jgi:hypothetical protein
MSESIRPDDARLAAARNEVQTFLRHKKALSRVLWWGAAVLEAGLLVGVLTFMDWSSRLHWFLLLGMLFVYCTLITFVWRVAVMVDQLYYRIVNDLKYDEQSDRQPGKGAG